MEWQGVRQRGNTLLKWLEEFQSKETHVPGGILAEHFGSYRRGLAGNNARSSGGRSGNREVNDLIRPQQMGGSHASARGADIERFCKLYEFGSRGVRGTEENGHLQANARGSSRVRVIHALTILQKTSVHDISLSTRELVRRQAYRVPYKSEKM